MRLDAVCPWQQLHADIDNCRQLRCHGSRDAFRSSRQVVSPIFRYLAAEIDQKGGSGMEISRRMGYDDVNECFCRMDAVR